MQHATLCIPVEGDPVRRVLLGMKRTGFGAGKLTGFGGKLEAGEAAAVAAARELEEEAGLSARPEDLHFAGCLTFLFPARPAWSQVVYLFLVARWQGQPVPSVEMDPAWFAVDEVPYERMWQDGAHWLPRALAGECTEARFSFHPDNETLDTVQIDGCEPALAAQMYEQVPEPGQGGSTEEAWYA